MAMVSWLVVCAAFVVGILAMNAAPVTAANADVSVGQGGNAFAPNNVSVNVGDTVTWNWVNGFHNVVAADGSFTSGAPHGSPGAPFAMTFNTAGTFFYYCEVHAPASAANDAGIAAGQMVGKVVVQAASQATATQAPTGTATQAPTGAATQAPSGTATPTVPRTGQAGLAEGSDSGLLAVLFLGLTVVTVAGARMVTQRPR
jgi:plastocyanin